MTWVEMPGAFEFHCPALKQKPGGWGLSYTLRDYFSNDYSVDFSKQL